MTKRNGWSVNGFGFRRLVLLLLMAVDAGDADAFLGEQVRSCFVLVVLVVIFVGVGVAHHEAQNVFVDAYGFLEVVLGERRKFGVRYGLGLVGLSSACVKLGEQLVRLNCDRSSGPVCASYVICNVFGQADGFDGETSEVAGADEAATEVEQDFGRPRSLGIAGVP